MSPHKLAPANSTGPVLAAAAAAVFLFLFDVGSPVATAQEAPAKGAKTRILTIADAIQLALTNNLDIRISQITPMIDQFTLNGLYAAYDPAFNFSAVRSINVSPGAGSLAGAPITIVPNTSTIESYSAGISGALPTGTTYNFTGPLQWQQFSSAFGSYSLYNSSPGITLGQPLLKNSWLNGPRYNISIAKKTLRIDQLALQLQIMTVINNVKAAYYNLIYSRENVRVEVAALQLADQLVQENRKKVQLGALAPLDEKQAESQAATSQADLLAAQDAQSVQENVLKNLLSGSFGEWAAVTPVPAEPLVAVPEAVDVMESWRKGVELRPELLQAKLNMEKQHITIKYDFNQLFPEVDLTGTYGHSASSATFSDAFDVLGHGHYPSYSYGMSMTVPLSNVGARNTYKSAKAALQQVLLQLKKTEQTIVIAIDNDVKAIRSDLLRVDATRKARIYAEDALQAEQTKLEHGKSTSFIVLQLQSNLTTARSAEIRALADYNIAVEQLALDEGTTLERNHIVLNGQP
jgi:outer membrane protein TolC